MDSDTAKIDAYIAAATPAAQPALRLIRETARAAAAAAS